MAVGLYTAHSITGAPTDDYPSLCHSLEFLLDGGKGRHRYLGFFKSESDEPVYGGLNTFQTAGVYGYELVQGPRLSLVLGAGLAVGDFGIELEDGTAWPIIPVPLLRMNYSSEWVDASFDFLTGPNLTVTLAPEKQVRFTGDFRMDEYPDLIYETLLHYRFFPADHPMGDIAGISVGFKNDVYGFDLAGEEEALEIQYRALFATIDLTLLKITGGYSFKEWNKESGMYVSLQGMYQF